MSSRELDLIQEGQNTRKLSPGQRLKAFFDVLELAEKLHQAGKREISLDED